MLKTIGAISLRIGVSILLLLFLFYRVDAGALWQLIGSIDKSDLVIACIVILAVDMLCFIRWDMLLKASGVPVPFKTLLKSFCGGMFFSIFLPTSIGGDVVKTLDLAAHTRKGTEVASTVFLDRLSGYVALVIVVILSCVLGWRYVQDAVVLFSVGFISVILICVLLVLFNKVAYDFINRRLYSPTAGRIRSAITEVHEEMHRLGKKKRVLFLNLCISFVVQLIGPLSSYVICLALGVRIDFIFFLIYLPIINALTLLPISLGGLGVRDAATVYFFAKAGLPRDIAFAMSLVGFSIVVVISCAGGLYYVLTLRHRRV
ncbi:MAG: lysylphosphatidylglycerol synthase transmembrane domain-containing protein [Candidatus Omnitrophota bacterium]